MIVTIRDDALDAQYALQQQLKRFLFLHGRSKQQHRRRVLEKRRDAHKYHDGDAHGTERIGDVPAELLNEKGGDYDSDAAQRVGQHVQIDAAHVLVRAALALLMMMTMAMI